MCRDYLFVDTIGRKKVNAPKYPREPDSPGNMSFIQELKF